MTSTPHYDYLVVGSGLFGATFAHEARQAGRRVLVVDRRPHLGGNVYCDRIEGINVHTYGAHIFHTADREVWDYVTRLVAFNRYTNCPVANYKGQLYNLPFNMNTFSQIWGVTTPAEAQARLEAERQDVRRAMEDAGVSEPRNLEEQARLLIGDTIYTRLIKEYTEKQWGRPCHALPASIIRRLPVRFVFDNNYFNDPYQGIPIGGYNRLVERLLEGVECRVSTDFFDGLHREWRSLARRLVYTGPIDRYFDHRLGRLDWRTVTFRTRVEPVPNYQGNAVINYTSHAQPYTRIIEHKHFEAFGQAVYDLPTTVVSEEYPAEYGPGMEPYYPVGDQRNSALAEGYRALAEGEEGVTFGGRLAQYRYYDMAPVIAQALQTARRLL